MDRILNENAILKNVDTVPYVAFPAFEAYPEIVCGFSTRLGGVSRLEFASMNLGFLRGDKSERVLENYRLLTKSMGIKPEQLIFTDQVHGTRLRIAGRADCGKGIFCERDYKGIDGHATNEPGAALLVFGADCVPLFFYDPATRAIATAHAGWRGTVGRIAGGMVSFMQEKFGSLPENLRVVIGPSIGSECYEVGEEVAEEFEKAFGRRVWEENPILARKEESLMPKYFVDLWEANRTALLEAGVKKEHIVVSGLCTMCRQDLFFSHRASGNKRGSMAGFMMLRN